MNILPNYTWNEGVHLKILTFLQKLSPYCTGWSIIGVPCFIINNFFVFWARGLKFWICELQNYTNWWLCFDKSGAREIGLDFNLLSWVLSSDFTKYPNLHRIHNTFLIPKTLNLVVNLHFASKNNFLEPYDIKWSFQEFKLSETDVVLSKI